MVLRPQIITRTNVTASFTAPAGARTAAMIGTAVWGPVNTVTNIVSLSEFISIFGGDITGDGVTGIKGADLFFRNGGTMKFVRVGDSSIAKADYTAQSSSTNVLEFEALYEGTHGNTILITITTVG